MATCHADTFQFYNLIVYKNKEAVVVNFVNMLHLFFYGYTEILVIRVKSISNNDEYEK